MPAHLVLRLDAPLIAFGGEAIDHYGVIRPFPAKSMIAGLIGNALGFERHEGDRIQHLQDALVIGSRIDAQGPLLRDYQNAELSKSDFGWTTRGKVEKRGGGMGERHTHQRYRDYWTECLVRVVVRMRGARSLDEIQSALLYPARPLFLGRKPCLPSGAIYDGKIEARDIFTGLKELGVPASERTAPLLHLQWPAAEGPKPGDGDFEEAMRVEPVCDERNWISGVHGGHRMVRVLTEARQPRREAAV